MALSFKNPIDYKSTINAFISQMKSRNDYLASSTSKENAVTSKKSEKTPGDKLFDPSIFKTAKNSLNLSHFTEILTSTNLSEQEKKFYKLQKFLLELANRDYQYVSDISTLFMKNAKHIEELMSIKKNGKDNKLIFLVPNSGLNKSNFWLSLFFIELTKNFLNPECYIDYTGRLSVNSAELNNLFDSQYNYLVVITDDISYSGSQLSISTYGVPKIDSRFTIFLNLVGYSDVAEKRLINDKSNTGTTSDLVFGNGAKNPLFKLSAKFYSSVENNVLYEKSKIDFGTTSHKVGVRMLSSLLLNDVFYMSTLGSSTIKFVSNIFDYYQHYEHLNSTQDNNGSIQYLAIKYPDSFSTVENMCKFKRLQNVAIVRLDRLINYLNLPGKTDLKKLDYLSEQILIKKLLNDNSRNVTISLKLLTLFIDKSDPDFPIVTDSFDKKFVDLFTKNIKNKSYINDLNSQLLNTFNKNTDDNNFNNLVLNKFVNLNNKISKFNKKHMLEFVMPKSSYQNKQTAKHTIKNCNSSKKFSPHDITILPYCNTSCDFNFYKKIQWN